MVNNLINGVMGVGYAILGVFIIYYKYLFIHLDKYPALILGVLFILYGIFRVYRAIQKSRE